MTTEAERLARDKCVPALATKRLIYWGDSERVVRALLPILAPLVEKANLCDGRGEMIDTLTKAISVENEKAEAMREVVEIVKRRGCVCDDLLEDMVCGCGYAAARDKLKDGPNPDIVAPPMDVVTHGESLSDKDTEQHREAMGQGHVELDEERGKE